MENFKGKILENLAEKNSECFWHIRMILLLKVYHPLKIDFVNVSQNL